SRRAEPVERRADAGQRTHRLRVPVVRHVLDKRAVPIEECCTEPLAPQHPPPVGMTRHHRRGNLGPAACWRWPYPALQTANIIPARPGAVLVTPLSMDRRP